MFHADPHPGNIYVEPGSPAHLIDWGMVGRLDKRMSNAVAMVIISLAANDGSGVAKAWIEMGRATRSANIPGFVNDMSSFVPTVAGASMEDLNFGVSLSSIIKYSTRRGIQTSPAIGLLGKAFANIEGSVRYLAPELSIVEVFEAEFQDIIFELAQEFLSEAQAARMAMEAMAGASAAPEQFRSLLRDLSNRELTLQMFDPKADSRAKATRHALIGVVLAAMWLDRRRRT
jgi:ubiquinone biosynthesis protein